MGAETAHLVLFPMTWAIPASSSGLSAASRAATTTDRRTERAVNVGSPAAAKAAVAMEENVLAPHSWSPSRLKNRAVLGDTVLRSRRSGAARLMRRENAFAVAEAAGAVNSRTPPVASVFE